MRNWSTDVKKLKKHPKEYTIWKLEQMINFGLDGKKINKTLLKKHFGELDIDPNKKKFLKLILK